LSTKDRIAFTDRLYGGARLWIKLCLAVGVRGTAPCFMQLQPSGQGKIRKEHH
jgi:hypothetical protein